MSACVRSFHVLYLPAALGQGLGQRPQFEVPLTFRGVGQTALAPRVQLRLPLTCEFWSSDALEKLLRLKPRTTEGIGGGPGGQGGEAQKGAALPTLT